MNEMTIRLAKALAPFVEAIADVARIAHWDESTSAAFAAQIAEAAATAMREPTEAMLEAGALAVAEIHDALPARIAMAAFRGMIDEARK